MKLIALSFLPVLLLLGLLHDVIGEEINIQGMQTRIVGGVVSNRNEFPWLVRIQRKSGKGLLCGGAIIRNDLILTAAHCFQGSKPGDFEIVAGDHDSSVSEGTEQIRNIRAVTLHEDYNPVTYVNDICLLRVSSNFSLGAAVNLISLPPQGYLPPGNSTVAGWGVASANGNSERILRKVTLPIVANSVCSVQYRYVENIAITSQMLCAGGISGKDSCQGDSGSPLMCTSGNGTFACGIVSFGVGCGQEGYSGVYTRASEYNSWIAANENNEGFQMASNFVLLISLLISLVIYRAKF